MKRKNEIMREKKLSIVIILINPWNKIDMIVNEKFGENINKKTEGA